MELFISWSGKRSREIAQHMHGWLPMLLQSAKPWMSSEDIRVGKRWLQDIAVALESSNFGIICVTPENRDSRWLLFEAGAISKQPSKSHVCAYLFDCEPTDITSPLADFQAVRATKDGTRKLVVGINDALPAERRLPDNRLFELFEVLWPKFEEKLKSVTKEEANEVPIRTDREILDELLEISRERARMTAECASSDAGIFVRNPYGKNRRVIPLEDVQIPDIWHLSQSIAKRNQRDGNLILELWNLAHDLLEHAKRVERGISADSLGASRKASKISHESDE